MSKNPGLNKHIKMMKEETKKSIQVDISNLFCYSCSTRFLNLDNFKSHHCSNVSKSTTSTAPTTTSPAKKKSDTKLKFYGRVKGGNGKSVVFKSRPAVNFKELRDYVHCCRCYTTFYKLMDLVKHFKSCRVEKTSETFQESKTQKKNQDEWSVKIVSMLPGQTTFRLEQTKNNVELNTSQENININTNTNTSTNKNDECLKSQKEGETNSSLLLLEKNIPAHEDSLDSPFQNSPSTNSPPSPIHQDSEIETETKTTHDNDNNIDIDVPSPCLYEIKEEEEEENSEIEKEDEDCLNKNSNNTNYNCNNNNRRESIIKSIYKEQQPPCPVADPSNVEFPFLTCPMCFRIFNHPSDKKRHMLQHGEKTLKCTECNYSCWIRKHLTVHMKQKHPGVDPYRCYRYPTCLMTFATREELSSHNKSHDRKRFHCPEPGCTRFFGQQKLILDHLNSHKNIRPHICDKCAATFETLDQLRKHLARHRTPTLKCDFEGCSKLFKSTTLLKSHQAIHCTEKRYKCTESGCDAAYRQEQRLKQHIKVMHKKEEQTLCPLCGKSFLRKGTFKQHLVTHSQEKNFHCNFQGCSFSFFDKYALNRHMRTHTGERKYGCSFPSCDKKFSNSSLKKRHEQTHTQAKPYVCAFCPQAFHDNRMLKKHVLSYHEHEEFDITVPLSYRAKESTKVIF